MNTAEDRTVADIVVWFARVMPISFPAEIGYFSETNMS